MLYEVITPLPPILLNWSQVAVEFYRAAYSLQLKIGEQFRIMAADNTYRNHQVMIPTLSVMEIPYTLMGEAAVSSIIAQYKGDEA